MQEVQETATTAHKYFTYLKWQNQHEYYTKLSEFHSQFRVMGFRSKNYSSNCLAVQNSFCISDFVSLDACGAYSSFASLKKILTFLRPIVASATRLRKKNKKTRLSILNFAHFFVSLHRRLVSPLVGGGRSYIWERRFRTSVVVHNESRKFQATADRWQPKRHVVRFYIPQFI